MRKIIPLFSLALLFACDGSTPAADGTLNEISSSIIKPLLTGDFTNTAVFDIDPTIENTLETPNGSSFTIPANALVDEKGQIISKPVSITFDQYHSASDILASGIPMEYDTLGAEYTFESAGMFTLKGACQNKPVYVKDGVSIAVNLASDKSGDEPFNFYALNENTGDWTYEHTNSPVRGNPKFDPSNYIPPRPEPVSDDAFVIDVNFDLSNYAELAIFSGIVWEYTGTNDSLDPRKNRGVGSTKWTEFDLEPTHEKAYEYYMTMSNSTKSFTTKVKAALDGEDMDLAMNAFKEAKLEAAKKMDELQKPYIRSVEIAGFGTYNYDYIYKIDAPTQMIADFDFGKFNSEKDHAMVAVIYEDEEVVVNYPKDKWNLFGINTAAEAKIIAILPNNQLAVCNEPVSDCYGKKNHTFKMKVLDKKVEHKDALLDVLASL